MKSHLFIPFNTRNNIIDEHNSKQSVKSIPKVVKSYELLKSYLTDKEIYDGIEKRINDKYTNLKARNAYALPYDNYIKGKLFSIRDFKEWVEADYKSSTLNFLPGFSSSRGRKTSTSAFSDTGLTTYWKMNASSGDIVNVSQAAADLGTAADLQVTSATYGATGKFDDAMSLDGVDDKLIAGTSVSQFNFLFAASGASTISYWVLTDSGVGDNETRTSTRDSGEGFIERYKLTNDAFQIITDDGTNDTTDTWDTIFTDHVSFHHIVITTVDTTVSFWFDGSDQGDKTFANIPNGDHEEAFEIGERASDWYTGDFDEYSTWNVTKSDADIASLYNSGTGLEIY